MTQRDPDAVIALRGRGDGGFDRVGSHAAGPYPLHVEAADWDARYAEQDLLWSAEANRFVIEHLSDLRPGTAIDLAAGDAVRNKKPAPDIYLYALEQLGLAADECLVFEDTEAGLASARAAGLATVITVNDSTRDQDFSGAAIVLDQLGEPERGFEVLQGDAGGASLVDVEFARRMHLESQA